MLEYEQYLDELRGKKPPLDEVMAALRASEANSRGVIPATVIYGLSELSQADRDILAGQWLGLSADLKARVLRALAEASEGLFELSFGEIAAISLADKDSAVRAAAIDALWYDDSPETMRQFMRLADDRDAQVRASALQGMANFLLLGEYGDIDAQLASQAQEVALRMHTDKAQPIEVRRRALEALANSSHPRVEGLIRAAYADANRDLRISAIFAMGRTCNPVWSECLLHELDCDDSEFVYEAIAACGQLQLKAAVKRISEFIASDDANLQLAAVAALGEIGGEYALELLGELADSTEDEALYEAIDEALDAAAFSFGLSTAE